MDDELNRRYRHWRLAETSGRDDDAEGAFRVVFASTVRECVVPTGFTPRTAALTSAL